MSEERKGALNMVAASICWSFGGLCIKAIPWGSMSIIGLRAALAAVVFAIYTKSVKIRLTPGNLLSAFCLSATTILFVFANKLTTAAAAILLQFIAPVFIVLLEFIFYKKRPRVGELLAVFATICGMVLFFVGKIEGGGTLGNILAIASGLSFAGVFVSNKRPDTNSGQSMLLGFLINSLIGLPFAFFQATPELVPWLAVIFLGVVQVGLAYVFFSIGIKRTPALLACLITALEPVLNPIWVAVVTKEIPGPFAIAGGGVIILTVVIYNMWVERQLPRNKKSEGNA